MPAESSFSVKSTQCIDKVLLVDHTKCGVNREEFQQRSVSRERRILVTGAAGFLGSRIVWAYEKSCQVFTPSHQEMDICHLDSVRAYVEKVRPGIAVHCAAVSDTLRCQEHPEESFRIRSILEVGGWNPTKRMRKYARPGSTEDRSWKRKRDV